jgi:Short C-terminal domain
MRRRPMVMRRGPGLLGTAAIGGIAYSAGRSGANRTAQEQRQNQEIADLQAQQAAAPPQAAPAPAAPAPAMAPDERIRQLRELGELKASGVLNEEEFQREKARLLGSS